jgi:hypothetical protein
MRSKASRSSGKQLPSRGVAGTRISIGPSLRIGSSTTKVAPMTADVLRTPRRGTPSSTRNQRTCTRRRRHMVASAQETRPSLGPKTRARQSSLHIGRKLDGEALMVASRLGKPAYAGGTNTGVVMSGRSAARRVSSLSQGSRMPRQKRKEVEASVPARTQSPGLVARTSSHAVAEVVRRRPGLE